jgi:hypothetical protein
MPNTGPNPAQIPTQSPASGATPIVVTAEQQAAADTHDRAAAKQRLTFALGDTLLPLMNQNVTVASLRYYVGLAIDQVLGSEDGLRLQQPPV